MNISGLDKAAVLAVLYNRAVPHGLGFLEYDRTPWTLEDARAYIEANKRPFDPEGVTFSWIHGRSMWIWLGTNDVHTLSYNTMNGPFAAEFAVSDYVNSGDVNPEWVDKGHTNALEYSKRDVKQKLSDVGLQPTIHGTNHIGSEYSEEDAERLKKVLQDLDHDDSTD